MFIENMSAVNPAQDSGMLSHVSLQAFYHTALSTVREAGGVVFHCYLIILLTGYLNISDTRIDKGAKSDVMQNNEVSGEKPHESAITMMWLIWFKFCHLLLFSHPLVKMALQRPTPQSALCSLIPSTLHILISY